ncbi:MAG: hypothetical protein ACLQGP_11920 [Isosphaeraceae bacterium]
MRVRRPPSRKGFRPGWERLEERIPLSLNIEFDDSYDSLGFFAENPAARTVLEEAAEIIGGQINDSLAAIAPDPAAGDTWTASFLDPTTGLERTVNNLSIPADTILIFVGGFAGQGSLGGQGGFGGYTVDGSPDWVDTVQTRGANSVIGIWGGAIRFNEDVDWSFAGTSGPPAANQVDFLTMAEHEIGRVLGLGTSPGWQAWVDGANDTFTGPHAEATYGGPVPLNPAGQFGDPADGLWAATVTSYGQAPTMDVTPLDPGVRRLFTSLDWAALDDIGWDTDHLVVTAQPPANVEGSEVFGISVAAEDPDGHVDTTFDGPVVLSMAGGGLLGATTVDASDGVATFTGLAVDQPVVDGIIVASADGGSLTATTTPLVVAGGSFAPQIIAERIIFVGAGKVKQPIEVELVFSSESDLSGADSSDRYAITQTVNKKGKSVVRPVPFIARYKTKTKSVNLLFLGKPSFSGGGQIIVESSPSGGSGNTSAAELTDTTEFTIRPHAIGLIAN